MLPEYLRKAQEAGKKAAQEAGSLEGLKQEELQRTGENRRHCSHQLDVAPVTWSGSPLQVRGRGTRTGTKPLLVHIPEEIHEELMRSGNAGQAAVGVLTWAIRELKQNKQTLAIDFTKR